MKVSIIDPVGGHGGMDYYDYGLAYGLAHNNLVVRYYTCSKTECRNYQNVTTINVFKNIWEKKYVNKLLFFLIGYFKAFKNSSLNNGDVLHFHFFSLGKLNLIVLILSFFFKQKKIVTLHDIESFHKGNSKLISKLCLKLIDGIIVHNNFSKLEFEKNFNFKRKIIVIPHGNYLPFIEPQKLNINPEKIKLLFFGQIKEVKGLDLLLESMAKVVEKSNKYHLTIAGRPWKTSAKYYTDKIQQLNLSKYVSTHFRYITELELTKFYKDASIIVMPYRKIYQSGVLLLSLSYGRTVIVSNLPAFTEVISDGNNGFIFESNNSVSLANSILNLNQKLISEVTENSKQIISKKYDWITIGKMTLNFYEKVICF